MKSNTIRAKLLSEAVTSKKEGTGRGLIIVKRILEANQGKISILYDLPTRFVVQIPSDEETFNQLQIEKLKKAEAS